MKMDGPVVDIPGPLKVKAVVDQIIPDNRRPHIPQINIGFILVKKPVVVDYDPVGDIPGPDSDLTVVSERFSCPEPG